MSRLRQQDGYSLPEVLIAMVLMLIVLGATLASLEGHQRRAKLDSTRVDAQENLRRGMDHLQRQLVNLATPSTDVESIAVADDFDLIFQTADPQKRWVRYCVNPSDPLIATGKSSLWYEVSGTAATTPPPVSGCPQRSGWTSSSAVGEAVVNGPARAVFTYNGSQDASGNVADTATVTRVRTELWVDTDPAARPAEQRLSSGVFLRNQNQTPVASFTWTDKLQGVVLNASATTDPEGRRLEYHWYYGVAPSTIPPLCAPRDPAPASDPPPTKYLGRGPVIDAFTPPPAVASSPQDVTLCVVDPGDLANKLTRSVAFP